MKTIFSYLAKCFLTYTLSFALLQVQVFLPIENLKHSSGYAMAADDGVTLDADGVATKSGKVDLEGKQTSAFLDILTMMAFGYFTSRAVMVYTPVPTDVMLAAGGGIIYAGGEVYAWNAFKDNKEKQIEYTMKEDGDNDLQIETLEKQKEGYDDIAETAKTKMTIQAAAGTAYLAAAVKAFYDYATGETLVFNCGKCPGSVAALAKQLAADEKIPRPSYMKGPQLLTESAALVPAVSADILAFDATCTASMGSDATSCSAAVLCTESAGSCNIQLGHYTNTVTISDGSALSGHVENTNSFDKFFHEKLQIKNSRPLFANIDKNEVKHEVNRVRNLYGLTSFIEESSPFYSFTSNSEIKGITLEEKVNSYIVNKERVDFFDGKYSSASLDDYNQLKSTMKIIEKNDEGIELNEVLEAALQNGVDLLIPSANANSFLAMFGAGVGIFLALKGVTATWVDQLMASPFGRGSAWTIGASLAAVAYTQTKKVKEVAEENSKKIQEIINKLSSQGLKNVDSLSGSQISIPSQIPLKLKGNPSLSLGDDKTPCPNSNSTSGCVSLEKSLSGNSTGFASLGGSFGALANTVGSAADGISGSSSIPSSSVDGLVELSKENQAMKKKLDTVQRKINEALKARGQSPIDFDKNNKKILAQMRKNTLKSLGSSGSTPESLLAAVGGNVASKATAKKKVAKVAPVNKKLKMTSGSSKKVGGGFKLELENEGSNDALQADEVLANQNAANAMNAEAQDDIVANKDVSIFKVISVRYLKSGFNKLLDEDK